MTMNILKSLSLSVLPTTQRMSPEQHRRNKLITKLAEQKLIAEADREGILPNIMHRRWVTTDGGSKALVDVPKRIKRWWFQDGVGNCLLAIRYGNKVLELEKGKGAIIVGKPDHLTLVRSKAHCAGIRSGGVFIQLHSVDNFPRH